MEHFKSTVNKNLKNKLFWFSTIIQKIERENRFDDSESKRTKKTNDSRPFEFSP